MSALRRADFRRLWLAGLISDSGDWLLLATLPIVVYQITGSTLGTATAFLIELVPPVLLAPVAGMVADRLDRRRTLTIVPLAQAVALLPLPLAHGKSGLPLVYAVIAVQSALATIFDPTKNALLPTLVDADQLVSANSLVGLNQNIGRLVGAPLGGFLLLAGGGLSTIAVVDAATFLTAVALISRLSPVRTPAAPASPGPSAHAGAAAPVHAPHPGAGAAPGPAGWRAALRARAVRGGLFAVFTTSVAQGLFVVLYVVFVARVLRGDAGEIGLLRGVQAIGAIGAGLLLAAAGRRLAPARLTVWATFGFGVLDLAIWNAPRLTVAEPLYVALFVAVGAPGVAMATGLLSVVQQATADGDRGRVFATFGVAASLGQATGMIAGGLLGDPLGVVTVLNGQGALYLLAALIVALAIRPAAGRAGASAWPQPALASCSPCDSPGAVGA